MAHGDPTRAAYLQANLDMVARAVAGLGPDGSRPVDGAGARLVINLSSADAPSFCAKGYLNAYQLHGKVSATRSEVDAALEQQTGLQPEQMVFAALSLAKSGVRFYGDLTLVLKPPTDDVHLIDRNSYDLKREPIAADIARHGPARAQAWIAQWHGTWQRDLPALLGLRALATLSSSERRWTSGQIARCALDDEDYVEAICAAKAPSKGFDATHVQEVRLNAADVALEAWIGERAARGPVPPAAQLLWRQQRHDAVAALQAAGIAVGVNTDEGRRRG